MPNIEQFEAKGAPEPSEQGVQAAVQSGRRIGMFYHQMGQDTAGVVKLLGDQHEEQVFRDEVSKGTVSLAQIQSQQLQSWNDQSTKAASSLQGLNNTHLAQDFVDQSVKPMLDQWVNQFSTPKGKMWATEQAADTYKRLWDKATAGQAELTGASAVANFQATANGHAESAFHDYEHTAQYAGLMEADTASIVQSHPGLDDSHLAALQTEVNGRKEQIAVSGVQGAIAAGDTKYARLMLSDPEMRGLLGDKISELSHQADAQDRLQAEQARQATAADKEQAETHAKEVAAQAQALLMSGPNGEPPSAAQRAQALQMLHDEALKNPLGSTAILGEFHSAAEVARTQTEDTINGTLTQDNPTAVADIAARIGSTTNPATLEQLNQLRINHQISNKSWEVYQTTIKDAADNPALKQAMEDLTRWEESMKPVFMSKGGGGGMPGLGGTTGEDPKRAVAFAQWTVDNRQRFQAWLHADNGHSPQEAVAIMTDAKNPRSVARGIPDYLRRADAAPDAGGVTASFLLDPTPITTADVARNQPGLAAGLQNGPAGVKGAGALTEGPGITAQDIAFAKAWHAKTGGQ